MKLKLYMLFSVIASIFVNEVTAQVPGVKRLQYHPATYPTLHRVFFDSKPTHDRGFILLGNDTTRNPISEDQMIRKFIGDEGGFSVAKIDSAGQQQWKQGPDYAGNASYGFYSAGTSIDLCNDGGYIVAGYSVGFWTVDSTSFLITKIDAQGNFQWSKKLGGRCVEIAYSVIQTSQGDYMVAGTTNSSDGDVTGHHGTLSGDAWVIKLDPSGNVQWKKCYGGTGWDTAHAIVETPDHGFIIAGSSSSSNNDLTGNNGKTDGWLLKIDGAGTIQWQKNVGGTENDCLRSLVLTEDGAVVAAGYTMSNNGDVTGNHGQQDVWAVKCNALTGNIIWSKCFGGTLSEYGFSVERTLNNEYLVGGFTKSSNGDVTFNNGGSDGWMLLLSAAGNLIWQKTVGSANNEYMVVANALSTNQFTMAGTGINPSGNGRFNGLFALLGNSNTIKGNVFFDANYNGTKDNGETGFSEALLKVDKGGVIVSSAPYNGKFSIDADMGSFVTSLTANTPYYTVVPLSHNSNFASYLNVDSFDFAVQPIPLQKDITISAVALTPARPGFNASYQVFYNNIGTENISNAVVSFIIDAKTSFVSAAPAPSTVAGNTRQWNIGTLNALQSGNIVINLKIAVPPTANNGDTLRFLATIDPVSGDLTPSNDTCRLKQLVTGSYDPNDKREINAGKITSKQVADGDYLTYLIRFQNTGTDTAFNINVRDTLDAQLDWNTLDMISTSHAYNLQVKDGDKITWTFDDIKLVDSNHNEPASHGYIAYRIKPKATLVDGDIINNTAAIYFDFNLPVATNREQTLIGDITPLPVKLGRFQAYLKRDKSVQVEWQSLEEINTSYFEVERSTNGPGFATIGKVPAKNIGNGASYSLVDNTPAKGPNYYRLKTIDIDGRTSYSPVVKINLDEKPVIITTIYPNPAQQQFRLDVKGAIKDHVTIKILGGSGQPVLIKDLGKLDTDSFTLPVNIHHLAAGIYILQVEIGQRIYRNRLVVQ
jgi:uncharacterized repeat protein (TIGR01451 family)